MNGDTNLNVAEFNDTMAAVDAKIAAGVKFTDDDMNALLMKAATCYAQRYVGNAFEYMVEMRGRANGRGLTTGQARGVMNCMLAEERRKAPAIQETVNVAGIITMLQAAKAHLKYPKIRLQADDGSQVVTSIAGDRARFPGSVSIMSEKDSYGEREWYGRIHTDGVVEFRNATGQAVRDIIVRFASDPEKVATEYGRLTGNCCFCGRKLEDERSTSVGYGPVCADHFGMTWGKKAVAQTAPVGISEACAGQVCGECKDAGCECHCHDYEKRDGEDFNAVWAAHKDEYARREREQEAAVYVGSAS